MAKPYSMDLRARTAAAVLKEGRSRGLTANRRLARTRGLLSGRPFFMTRTRAIKGSKSDSTQSRLTIPSHFLSQGIAECAAFSASKNATRQLSMCFLRQSAGK
jgi:hypothetical protein